jgi:hypothetical protein
MNFFVVGTFAAKRGPIFAPRLHHCFPKPISHILSELGFYETPIPTRRPALAARTINRLPEIPGSVLGAIRSENLARVSHDFAPEHHPTFVRLGCTSFSLLDKLFGLRLLPTQFRRTHRFSFGYR